MACDVEGHTPVSGLFKCKSSTFMQHFTRVQLARPHCTVPQNSWASCFLCSVFLICFFCLSDVVTLLYIGLACCTLFVCCLMANKGIINTLTFFLLLTFITQFKLTCNKP